MNRAAWFTLAALSLSATGALAQDSDGDGVVDSADAFPCDATRAGAAFAPAEGTFGTLMFEDHWPNKDDQDFNDAVFAYHVVAISNAAGETTSWQLTLQPRALGGDFDNGLGLALPVSAGLVTQVTRTVNGTSQALAPSSADANLTVTVSTNLRELFSNTGGPINVKADQPNLAGQGIVVDVQFAPGVNLGAALEDVFLFRSNDPRHEIHRPEYRGTAAMDQSLFGSADDGSDPARAFIDGQGLPFAIVLPELAPYPSERTTISTLFPTITEFAASGGTARQDFYATQVNSSAQYADNAGQPAPTPTAPTVTVDNSCVNPFQSHLLVDMPFDTHANLGTWSVSRVGTPQLAPTGGVGGGSHVTGMSNRSHCYDIADIHVGGAGANTFVAWYKGTQTNSSARPYQTGVLIFGDPAGSVWIGLGVDQGKIAIANGRFSRGTTNVADGQWHQLVWTREGTTWNAYVDGVREIAGFGGGASAGNEYIRDIGCGYPYGGTASPTALDGVQIYDSALIAEEVLFLFDPNAPLPLCTDGVQNGSETGVDCGGSRCLPCPAVPLVDIQFESGLDNQGTASVVMTGSLQFNGSGGVTNSGYASGFTRSDRLDVTDIWVGGGGEHTFAAWYRGTQTAASARPYQTGVLIFGDHHGSVWIGLGVDGGKIAIANGSTRRGTTTVADGQWHHLAWVRRGNLWDLYVDGVKEVSQYSATGSTGNQYIRLIGDGYPYGGTVNPTALDGVLIYDVAYSDAGVAALAAP